jgi:hypothetical protein
MRNIIFVGHSTSGACKMRGVQTVQALEKYSSLKPSYILGNIFVKEVNTIKNSVIIFVGEPLHIVNPQMLEVLNKNNNVLIYDVIDNFCFHHTNILHNDNLFDPYKCLDVIIHTNSYSKNKTEEYLPNVKHIIIPHQWDIDNETLLTPNITNTNVASYIGGLGGFQLDKNKLTGYIDVFDNVSNGNDQHTKYNIHSSFRASNTLDYFYKPCTKLAVASCFGSILLTSREESVVDIVGESYEFYINNEDDFKKKMDWIRGMSMNQIHHYRNNMRAVKEYLSPKSTADRYNNLIKKYI